MGQACDGVQVISVAMAETASKVTLAGDGEAGLDDVADAQLLESLGDLKLFPRFQRCAGRFVRRRGVVVMEDPDHGRCALTAALVNHLKKGTCVKGGHRVCSFIKTSAWC